MRDVAELGDQARGGLGPDAVDRREELADLVVLERALDVLAQRADPPAQQVDVLAGEAHLGPVDLRVVTADRARRGADEILRQLAAHLVEAVVAEIGEALDRDADEGLSSRVLVEDRGRELAVERPDEADKLGEVEVHQPVELPHAVAEVLDEAVAQPHELAQLLGGGVGDPRRRGPLLPREARDPQGVDRVGLGPLQVLAGEAVGPERIDERDREAAGQEVRDEIAPVVAGRLHGDQHPLRRAEQLEELRVARRVLVEGRRTHEHLLGLVHDRDHVRLRRDVDPCVAHFAPPVRRGGPGASEPATLLTLVHARTRVRAPQEPVRALVAGRGRRSHTRGLRPKGGNAATLSRLSSIEGYATGGLR